MIINDKEIKGVIFDMDGVVLDSMPVWNEVVLKFTEGLGPGAREELIETAFSMSMEQGIAYFKERYGLSQTEEEIRSELQSFLMRRYRYDVEAKHGAKELMESFAAAGIRMTAATSSPRVIIECALERNGLLGYIDKIFTSDEVGSSKHDPEIYHLAAEYMGTSPEETLVFEDSLYALKTAKAAGFTTAGIYDAAGEPDQESLKAKADIYVKDAAEFLAEYPVQ